jgi:hypothetical protein
MEKVKREALLAVEYVLTVETVSAGRLVNDVPNHAPQEILPVRICIHRGGYVIEQLRDLLRAPNVRSLIFRNSVESSLAEGVLDVELSSFECLHRRTVFVREIVVNVGTNAIGKIFRRFGSSLDWPVSATGGKRHHERPLNVKDSFRMVR